MPFFCSDISDKLRISQRRHMLCKAHRKQAAMFKNSTELIKVKTIVTIIVLAVWAHLAVTGAITADAV